MLHLCSITKTGWLKYKLSGFVLRALRIETFS